MAEKTRRPRQLRVVIELEDNVGFILEKKVLEIPIHLHKAPDSTITEYSYDDKKLLDTISGVFQRI